MARHRRLRIGRRVLRPSSARSLWRPARCGHSHASSSRPLQGARPRRRCRDLGAIDTWPLLGLGVPPEVDRRGLDIRDLVAYLHEGGAEHVVAAILDRWERAPRCRWTLQPGDTRQPGTPPFVFSRRPNPSVSRPSIRTRKVAISTRTSYRRPSLSNGADTGSCWARTSSRIQGAAGPRRSPSNRPWPPIVPSRSRIMARSRPCTIESSPVPARQAVSCPPGLSLHLRARIFPDWITTRGSTACSGTWRLSTPPVYREHTRYNRAHPSSARLPTSGPTDDTSYSIPRRLAFRIAS